MQCKCSQEEIDLLLTVPGNHIAHLHIVQCMCSGKEEDVYLDKACAHALDSIQLDGQAVI